MTKFIKLCWWILLCIMVVTIDFPVFATGVYLPPADSYESYKAFAAAEPELVEKETHVPLGRFASLGELAEVRSNGHFYEYSITDKNGKTMILQSFLSVLEVYALPVSANDAAHLGTLLLATLPEPEESLYVPSTVYYVLEVNGASYWYVRYAEGQEPILNYIQFPGEKTGMDDIIISVENAENYPLTEKNTMMARLLDPAEAEAAVAEMYTRIEGDYREPWQIAAVVLCGAVLLGILCTTVVIIRRRARLKTTVAAGMSTFICTSTKETPPPDN